MGTMGKAVFGIVLLVIGGVMELLMTWDALFLLPALICGLTGVVLVVLGGLEIRDMKDDDRPLR